jgi:hypothetical protein
MKKAVLLIIAIAIAVVAFSQTITNVGAKIIVKDGTYVLFQNIHNSQTGGYLYYDTDLIVPGDWTNDSPATFAQGVNGSVTFNGNTVQNVKSGGSAFGKLTINNSSSNAHDIVLTDDLTITSEMTLSNGIVNANTNKLIFADGSTSNSGNASSFVDGQMNKIGATQFTFPCGDINSRDLDGDAVNENYVVWSPLKTNPVASTTVSAEYFFDNNGMPDWWEHGGNMAATLHHVSDREFYLVSSTENFSDATIYWSDNSHATGDICIHSLCDGTEADFLPADLSVVYWNGNQWIDVEFQSGFSNLVHDQGYITSRFGVPFGAKGQTFITFGSKNNINPLPVELISFTADCNSKAVDLIWQTASETNNAGFVVEKSNDAKIFSQIGFVNGAGNSNSLSTYVFTDNSPSNLKSYYRLKQVDTDGKSTYSNIVLTECTGIDIPKPTFIVYPNPFKTDINIVAENLPNTEVVVNIYNILGSLIYQYKNDATNGKFFTQIDLSDMPPAMYVVKIISGDFVGVTKVEKQ